MHDEIAWMPATQMAAAIRTKKLSPVEVTKAFLERIEAINPKINAYCLVTPEMALAQAREAEAAVSRGDKLGPLHGVPVSIKDLFDVPGLPTTKGSLIYKDNIATSWEYSAKALIDAGGVHLGKTNTPEFGFIAMTHNKLFGTTTNPWDPTRIAGGSSGGAAAAVAAGLGPIALGSDGGGSIRIPASICGVFGLKATYGRVPRKPGGWSTMTHRGPITRTVAEAALALDVMAYQEPDDPFSVPAYPGSFLADVERNPGSGIKGLRVAWSADLRFAPVEPEVAAICERAAKRFAELGCEVEEAAPGFGNQSQTFLRINTPADAVWIGDLTEEQRALIDAPARFFFDYGVKVSGMEMVRANLDRMRLWETMRAFHAKYDLLLTPVISCTAFPVGKEPKEIAGREIAPSGWMPYTQPFNLTGQPAASVPCGFDAKGLPVGLHVIGRAYEDSLVLRACRAFEELAPWADKRPAIA
ncbi:MAG TPA: amidase family protein [Dehalococcoidia bacterium]|nr:amidase family protein [Dehalococcoidia bacterium]